MYVYTLLVFTANRYIVPLYKVITDIYKQVEEKDMFDYVEPHTTAFMTELGIPIYFSKGSHNNIKITTKEDIDMFLGYLLAQKYKEKHKEFAKYEK